MGYSRRPSGDGSFSPDRAEDCGANVQSLLDIQQLHHLQFDKGKESKVKGKSFVIIQLYNNISIGQMDGK